MSEFRSLDGLQSSEKTSKSDFNSDSGRSELRARLAQAKKSMPSPKVSGLHFDFFSFGMPSCLSCQCPRSTPSTSLTAPERLHFLTEMMKSKFTTANPTCLEKVQRNSLQLGMSSAALVAPRTATSSSQTYHDR